MTVDDAPGGKPPAAQETAERETARVKAELANLDDGSDPFAAAVRTTRMPMVITDPRQADNPIVFANDAFSRLTGYPREEIVGRNCRFLQGPETDPDAVRRIRSAIEAQEPIEIDIRNHTRDGRPFWNRLLIAPVRDADGAVAYFFASQFDVSRDRDSLADRTRELGEANERLRAEAAERGRIEETLRQSQKMEAIGQLTGGLAHDFNNLLTGIAGSLEMLQARAAQGRLADLDRYIAAAQGAAKRAAALTHRLLAFSRRQTLASRPTDVNRLVAGMEELVRRTVGPEIAVEVVGAGGLWSTLVDPNQLENALLNLCINARDAMARPAPGAGDPKAGNSGAGAPGTGIRPGGGRLTVETGNRWLDARAARGHDLPPGQYVSLCVSDTGAGMTPEVVRRAFDPFFTTKPLGQGTGLGLSMIYGFVRQSGGQARIRSEPGEGTTVCLYFPRHLGRSEAAEDEAGLAAPSRAGQGETVLVVDDEPTVRMLVGDVLQDLGYAAIEAADGAAGLRVLESDARVDLLVTDVGLPGGMNGRQVADAGRALRPGLKVLFITGYAENAALGHGHLERGMHVLTKPFALEALASRIKELIAAPA